MEETERAAASVLATAPGPELGRFDDWEPVLAEGFRRGVGMHARVEALTAARGRIADLRKGGGARHIDMPAEGRSVP